MSLLAQSTGKLHKYDNIGGVQSKMWHRYTNYMTLVGNINLLGQMCDERPPVTNMLQIQQIAQITHGNLILHYSVLLTSTRQCTSRLEAIIPEL